RRSRVPRTERPAPSAGCYTARTAKLDRDHPVGLGFFISRLCEKFHKPMIIPVLTAYEKEHIAERQALPEAYLGLSDEEMDRRIVAAKATLGRRLLILGHHYQRDEVIKF